MGLSEDQLKFLDSLEEELPGGAEGFAGELSEEDSGLLAELADEAKVETKKEKPKEEDKEEETEEEEESEPGLTAEAKLQLMNQDERKPPKKEEREAFDTKKFVKLLEEDVQSAWDYVEPYTKAGQAREQLSSQIENIQRQQMTDASERFIDKNPDYPFDNKEVNDFLSAAVIKLNLPWTAGNLTKVWKQMKSEGLAKGRKVEKAESISDQPGTKVTKKAAAPPVAPAKGSRTGTGKPKTGGSADIFKGLEKLIEETDDIDALEAKLLGKGLGEEGALSRLVGN